MPTKSTRYDAVVVGSGFGGAAAALTFAEAGLRTVLLERGAWIHRDDLDWSPRDILLRKRYRGRSSMEVLLYGRRKPVVDFPNEAVGGNSVFYGGASLRLRPEDFGTWPIDYGDLADDYAGAEALLAVHGESVPGGVAYGHEAIPLSAPAERIAQAATSLGLTPRRIPLAINFSDSARPLCIRCNTCDGFPCRIEAKNDLAVTLLRRAQAAGLEIVAGAVVERVALAGTRARAVTGVDASTGAPFEISGDVIVLAAGALGSPQILLRSEPGSGAGREVVGRYLMRHCNVIVTCVFPFRTNPDAVFHKQICLEDFYEDERDRTGMAVGVIQDIYTPNVEVMRHHAPAWGRWAVTLTHSRMQNLLCVAEDEARPENRVELGEARDPFGMPTARVVHDYTEGDYVRSRHLARQATRVLKAAGGHFPYRYRIDTFSHAVGTVRFGENPAVSALDEACRLRGVDNLYVCDGSFMPSSGGVNPSLTIAANGLRVARGIVGVAS